MIPQVGDTVLALVDPSTNNGADVAPAQITRVWGDPQNGQWGTFSSINAKVNLDGQDVVWLTSVYLYDDEQHARDCLKANPTIRVLFKKTAVIS